MAQCFQCVRENSIWDRASWSEIRRNEPRKGRSSLASAMALGKWTRPASPEGTTEVQSRKHLKKQTKSLPWLCSITLLLTTPLVLLQAKTRSQEHRTVVVISLDGFPAYALDDPRLPIPTLRKLAREGAVATSMRPVNPTVTWPNHTAIVTGVEPSEHQVLFNGLLLRPQDGAQPSIEPWRDKEQMVHAQTVYDAAFEAGLTTAQVDWVAIYRAKTITWQFPELPDPTGAIERELISAGTVTPDQLRTFEASTQAWQDEIWTAAAEDILEKHKPNLLLFHLLTLDDTNHEYGPMTAASLTAMAFLDAKVRQIVDTLQRTGLSNDATLIIVSDHGFRTFKHKIQPNVLLHDKGLLKSGPGRPTGDAWVMPEGGSALVYVSDPARRAELVPELRRIFTTTDGIEGVYGPRNLPNLDCRRRRRAIRRPTSCSPQRLTICSAMTCRVTTSPTCPLRVPTATSIPIPRCRRSSLLGEPAFRKAFNSATSPTWTLHPQSLRYWGLR